MVVTARTSERIIPKRESDGVTPPIQREKETMLRGVDSSNKTVIGLAVSGINAVVANHLKMLFGDMTDKPLDEMHSRNCLVNQLVVFVSVVMEGNKLTVIGVDSRGSNNRSA